MSYCGTHDVKWFSRITYDQLKFASDVEYGNWILGTLIPKSKDLIDSYVGHDFECTGGTIVLDGSGKEVLHINRRGLVYPHLMASDGVTYTIRPPHLMPVPLITITYVAIDGVQRTPNTDFKCYDAFVAYENNCFDCGRQNVEIRGTWGYATYPNDIRNVAMSICTNVLRGMLKRWLAPDLITRAVMARGGLTSYYAEDLELTPDLKLILDRYRFPEVG